MNLLGSKVWFNANFSLNFMCCVRVPVKVRQTTPPIIHLLAKWFLGMHRASSFSNWRFSKIYNVGVLNCLLKIIA